MSKNEDKVMTYTADQRQILTNVRQYLQYNNKIQKCALNA